MMCFHKNVPLSAFKIKNRVSRREIILADTIARKVNNVKASWIKIKAITIKGMLSLIERSDKK